MSPRLHSPAHTAAVRALDAGGHVLIVAAPGLGRTSLGLAVAEEFAARHGHRLVRVAVIAGGSESPLHALLPAHAHNASLTGAAFVDALSDELGDDAVLFVDDAHRLDDDDARALAALLRRPRGRPAAVLGLAEIPGRGAPLQALHRDRLATLVRLQPVDLDQAEALIQSRVHPEQVLPDTVNHIREQCGGVPLLLTEYTDSLRLRHSAVSRRGFVVWDRTTVHAIDPVELGAVLTADLTPEAASAARAIATVTALSPGVVAALFSPAALADVRSSGLVVASGSGAAERLRFEHPFAADVLTVSDDAAPALLARLRSVLDVEARPLGDWADDELEGIVLLASRCGEHLSLDLTRRAWSTGVTDPRHAHRMALCSAIIEHPDASVDDRLTALGDRIAGTRSLSDHAQPAADILRGVPLLPHASPAARVAFTTARARMTMLLSEVPRDGVDVIDAELAAIDGSDPESVRARERLRIERPAILAFAGDHGAAYDDLAALFADGQVHIDRIQTVGAYTFLTAQRGEVTAGTDVAGRYFPRTLSMGDEYPWLSSELVAAGFILDIMTGRVNAAARTVKRLDSALMKIASRRLPPQQPGMLASGRAMLAAAQGSWNAAAEFYEAAMTSIEASDAFGIGAHNLSCAAVAFAAIGETEAAWDALIQVQETASGSSPILHPWIHAQRLLAELWLGQDIAADALALADSSRDAGLALIELRALHLHALARGAQTPPDVAARAETLGAVMDAPIAMPLTIHIRELAAGLSRLDGQGPRLLARHGLFIPSRGVPGELTPRERQVATATALGFSAKAIAAQFGNSKRTIDAHLSRIYVKLGITGREDLAEALDAARD